MDTHSRSQFDAGLSASTIVDCSATNAMIAPAISSVTMSVTMNSVSADSESVWQGNLQTFLGFLKYSGLAYFLKLMLPDLTDSDSASDGVGLGVRVTPRKSTPIRSSLL